MKEGILYCKYCGGDFPEEDKRRGRPLEFCSEECRIAKHHLDLNRNAENQYEKRKKTMFILESYYAKSLAKTSYTRFAVWVKDNCAMSKEEEVKRIYEKLIS